ncbi:Terpenoid synthase [Metarhizium album ARSEF 1941]|uniref:Terpenoid synthase n=1 Tax=Metarhizium album (strain ARSEF 1941) TaxID=1081103 RepID=A0A0B2WRD3_METAS|nr:Terpenoid synthase [Metarhizium album ARSEF 1941]KHN95540.1 Terpenoid synthase [Metarhizium album ARSEF 1941]
MDPISHYQTPKRRLFEYILDHNESCWQQHPDHEQIEKAVVSEYKQLEPKMSPPHTKLAQYVFVGMFASYAYCYGRTEQVMDVAKYLIPHTYIDDCIDSTLDPATAEAACAGLGNVFGESQQVGPEAGVDPEHFRRVAKLFRRDKWDEDAYEIIKSFFSKYLDATTSLRAYECRDRIPTMDQYVGLRPHNVYMPAIHFINVYTGFKGKKLHVSSFRNRRVLATVMLSSFNVALLLDVILHAGLERPDETKVANLIAVVKAGQGLDDMQAAEKIGRMFFENETLIERSAAELQPHWPVEAEAIMHTHKSTLFWVCRAESRYMKGSRRPV